MRRCVAAGARGASFAQALAERGDAALRQTSRLYTSLDGFLTDSTAIGYLVDFLKKRKAGAPAMWRG